MVEGGIADRPEATHNCFYFYWSALYDTRFNWTTSARTAPSRAALQGRTHIKPFIQRVMSLPCRQTSSRLGHD